MERQAVLAGLAVLLVAAVTVFSARRARETATVQAELDQVGRWLKGTVILVDPGHGGDDPGAVVGTTLEKTLVLDISLALKQMLEQHGAKVVLTREGDIDLGGRIREELAKRVALVDKHKAQVYVSIHANKDPCRCWGAQTFYQRNGMPAGKDLAMAIQRRLRQMTPTTRTELDADYFVLRTSPVPSAVVEVGFLTNAEEHQRLKDPAYQRKLATAVALGLADYFRSQVPDAQSEGSIGR